MLVILVVLFNLLVPGAPIIDDDPEPFVSVGIIDDDPEPFIAIIDDTPEPI